MYISFDKKRNATLLIPQDEQRFWYTAGHWKEPINCSNFLSDLLSINFNELRNYYISTITDSSSKLFDNAHDMEEVTKFLQKAQIFPSIFECKATPYLLWQMGYDFGTLMALYDALLLLKLNDFSLSCAQEMCANTRPSFALQQGSAPTLHFLNTPEMMIVDVLERFELSSEGESSLKKLATNLLNSSTYETFLNNATSLPRDAFVEMYFPPELHGKQIVETIYNCLSNRSVNRHMRKEFSRYSNDSYGNASYRNARHSRILTTSQISKITSSTILAESHLDKFKWINYFHELYGKYQVPNEYCVNHDNVFELLGLVVQHVSVNGNKPKKCLYCNCFSFKLTKKTCPNCAKKHAKALKAEADRACARRRNKTSVFDENRDWYIAEKQAYLNLYDAVYWRMEELSVHKIRMRNYKGLIPKPIASEDSINFHLNFHEYLDDILAQNEAEKMLLAYEHDAAHKYSILNGLWKEYLLPSHFHKHVLPEGASEINITCLEEAFTPHVGVINYLREREDAKRVKKKRQGAKKKVGQKQVANEMEI